MLNNDAFNIYLVSCYLRRPEQLFAKVLYFGINSRGTPPYSRPWGESSRCHSSPEGERREGKIKVFFFGGSEGKLGAVSVFAKKSTYASLRRHGAMGSFQSKFQRTRKKKKTAFLGKSKNFIQKLHFRERCLVFPEQNLYKQVPTTPTYLWRGWAGLVVLLGPVIHT